ncbi:MAG: hypothetical protein R3268_02620 [Acidiferrobacterales bacterium]|nr:hypothetical protein [Acidiferrobacterales bacterium]
MTVQQIKLALWRTVRTAWTFYAIHFGTLLKINAPAWTLLVVGGIVLNSVLIQAGFQPNAGPSLIVLLSWTLSLYLLCHTVVTTHRYVLVDERPATNPVRALFSQRSLRCLGYLALFIIAAFYGFNVMLGWLMLFMPTMSIIVIVAALLLWAMLGRMVFVLPAVATDAKTDLMTSLAQTKGNSLRVFFMILVIFVPFIIAHQVALWFDPYELRLTSWLLAVLRSSIVFNAVVIASVGLALAYRALVTRPQAEIPSEVPPLTRARTVHELAPATRWIFWFIVASGMALPWAVGIGVKFYLDAQGLPTWPWRFFLDPARFVLELTLTLVFASPFITLAFLARYLLSAPLWGTRYWERLLVILCALLGGAVGTVRTFLLVFLQFQPMNLFAPLPLLYVDDMLRGLLVGCIIAGLSALTRKLIFRA